MLCPACRRQVSRSESYCGSCGAPLAGAAAPLELVLADQTRLPVVDTLTIGRAPGNTLQIQDPSVSRSHARIVAGNGSASGTVIEDMGSSHGTYVDGRRVTGAIPLRDGAKIRIGDAEMAVERRRSDAEEGRTIVVKAGATLMLSASGTDLTAQATQFGMKPKLRSGYALKRLDESEGQFRWILRDLKTNTFRRLDDADAALLQLLDGRNSLVNLIGMAEQVAGAGGSARLARLLSDLGERGFLEGVAGSSGGGPEAPKGFIRRMVGPHEKTWEGLSGFFDRVYRRGGWVLFTRPVLAFLALLVAGGLATFVALILGRYGTPFVVARKIGVGGLIFLFGRFAFVAVHEVAHGLTMSSYGRRTGKVGLKAFFIIPYVFVDTSEAWFEPRRRRIAVSAAGPVSDLSLGGFFAIMCLVWPSSGTVRDIWFNLAFAAYVGGIFNLNPFLDRDGYHIMVDVLKEPQLRTRARNQFNAILSGRKRRQEGSAVLLRYSLASVGWLAVMGSFAIFMSHRYAPIMKNFAPPAVVNGVLFSLWFVVFIPVFFTVGKPLYDRFRRRGESEAPLVAT